MFGEVKKKLYLCTIKKLSMQNRFTNNALHHSAMTVVCVLVCTLWALLMPSRAMAQMGKVMSPMVHTLQTIVNDDWMQEPTMVLGSDDYVTVSFDMFTHEYHRLCVHLVHCDARWQPSELSESEYLEGFNDRPIEYYANSLNTTFLYTHYAVSFPNDDVTMKVSGNYRVVIFEDKKDAELAPGQPQYKGFPVVAEACFRVVEPHVNVTAEVTANTDIDTYADHQQVSFIINHDDYPIDHPERELTVSVCQNSRPDRMVTNLQPTHIVPGRLEYVHQRRLIFPGDNEWRRFEIINMHYGSQRVDQISYFEPYYHAELLMDDERRAYTFDADHNGRFLVRYNLAEDDDTEADYLFVHFALATRQPLIGGKMYVTGRFVHNRLTPECLLEYNPVDEAYEGTVLLKMGAYDYQYVFVPDAAKAPDGPLQPSNPLDGSFYETENEYTISVYHRPLGERYDRLIAVETVTFSQE